ncbi:hypothetical protein ASPZODRAFT_129988 [Penicilliopsis zonata CBS 506.65]|uniref:ATP synthase mitochondrial F1 complex assembly factor 2 n=1 Tax=Penicilliopsis zonata CBS 506.65 TaxID=1073090 RepID=A0A1L9SLK2_9EURO|nr:hypothetical protein ASPZODRAFT_129988 [Penicilliopsis zonata CBS 506.65]OJJ48070.1 hypothetical protein ASPZODRAFT_129988 [Penicilliopsis zonata CBS 506.65]
MASFPRALQTLPRRLTSRPVHGLSSPISRAFQTCTVKAAVAHPITAHGPPPKAPEPAPEFDRVTGQAAKAERGSTETANGTQPPPSQVSSLLKKRFWKDVHVVKNKDGNYTVLLDKRPVRTPGKEIISIPSTKPFLAHTIALEWDVMTSAQQALKNHLIPLTSLTSRAADIALEDEHGQTTTREQILSTTMRYLETDTLLCWVPAQERYNAEATAEGNEAQESLRDIQMRVAKDVIGFLSTNVWPGIEILPVLDTNSILPTPQPQATQEIIRQWVSNLSPYDLAALERGTLAAKSLLVAVRLVVEWSESFRHLQGSGPKRFGIEEAAEAASLEVRWQTDMWGEVEDTHDVNREDLRRQLGSVVVLVTGEKQ